MGIADGLMLDVFGAFLGDSAMATNLELLSRAISFYLCVILCGISFLLRCAQHSFRTKNRPRKALVQEDKHGAVPEENQ